MKRSQSKNSSGLAQRRGATLAVHAGENQTSARRTATVPIYQTIPFLFDSAEEVAAAFGSTDLSGIYSRYGNPTVRCVEEKLAALEGADDAVAFASGMAAITTTLRTVLGPGDRLLAGADLYGGTFAWLQRFAKTMTGLTVDRVETSQLAQALGNGAAQGAKAIYIETPTNPLLSCCDLEHTAQAARDAGAILVVDSTFATPALQQPLALGAHLVVHSATKALAGHSDVCAGFATGDLERVTAIRKNAILEGGCLDPHAAFLLGRGMKTLQLRIDRMSQTAARLADTLAGHSAVERVLYPGNDPIGQRQMTAGGGMLAVDVGSGERAAAVLNHLEVFEIYPSLGGVESGVILPAVSSHRQLSPEERQKIGITDGLIRVSCGIEDPDDLEADFLQALSTAVATESR